MLNFAVYLTSIGTWHSSFGLEQQMIIMLTPPAAADGHARMQISHSGSWTSCTWCGGPSTSIVWNNALRKLRATPPKGMKADKERKVEIQRRHRPRSWCVSILLSHWTERHPYRQLLHPWHCVPPNNVMTAAQCRGW